MDFKLADGRRFQGVHFLGSGQFGAVWALHDSPLVAKVFSNTDNDTLHDRLTAVVRDYRCDWLEPDCSGLQCWPQATLDEPGPGVVMRRVPQEMLPLGAWMEPSPIKALKRLPRDRRSYRTRVRICLHLCEAVGVMHAQGLCHGDLSPNNVHADPVSGEVRLIDLDGLAVPGYVRALQAGTPRYMAPEIEARQAEPSIIGDLHALATILHRLLLLHDPFEGVFPYSPDGDTEEDQQQRYSFDGIWNLDPDNDSNRPTRYVPLLLPEDLGENLLGLFRRALTVGLHRPGMRPTTSEWIGALATLDDCLIPCPACSQGIDWLPLDRVDARPLCWACDEPVQRDGWVLADLLDPESAGEDAAPKPTRSRQLVLYDGLQLCRSHLIPGWSGAPSRNLQTLATVGFDGQEWTLRSTEPLSMLRMSGSGTLALQSPASLSAGHTISVGPVGKRRLLGMHAPRNDPPEEAASHLEVAWQAQRLMVAPRVAGRGLLIDLDRLATGSTRGYPAARVFWTSTHGWRLTIFAAPEGKRLERFDGLPLSLGTCPVPIHSRVFLAGERLTFRKCAQSGAPE